MFSYFFHLISVIKFKDFDGGKTYDLHGRSSSELDSLIDRLSIEGQVVQIVTGNGRGILKERLLDLQAVYKFKIISVAHNDASFVLDFS